MAKSDRAFVCVLTGASCSGKTSLIDHFARRGYPVMHEVARDLIAENKLHPARQPFAFQRELARRHLEREGEVRSAASDFAFLDRGLYDGLAFCRSFGLKKIPKLFRETPHYDLVCFLDPLNNFERDGIRIEKDAREAAEIKNLIEAEYVKRNIPIVRVPVLSIARRADFILRSAQKINRMKHHE